MQRVVVVGSTGAGKTTFATALAARLGAAHVELDALHWDPGWTPATADVFRLRAAAALATADRWVADGNYSVVRDLVWSRADTLVWLDYPFPLLFYRLARRTFARGLRRQELWNGNREDLRTHFFSRESLFLWLVRTYRRRRRGYPALFTRPEYAHLTVHHFRSPRAAQEWLAQATTVMPAER